MTVNETPAETLRRAAKLMRKRAEAATPGPWAVAEPTQREGHRVGSADGRDWVAWTGDFGEEFSPADAAHIASLHPRVAMSIAAWLDKEAIEYDEIAATPYGDAGAAFVAGDFGGDIDPAVEFARTYLGEAS